MYRTSFRSPQDGREALLDALLPLLPTGVHEGPDTLSVISGAALDRAVLEAAAGHALEGWGVEEVPADWRHRRGEEGVLIGGRVCIRSPFDPATRRGDRRRRRRAPRQRASGPARTRRRRCASR